MVLMVDAPGVCEGGKAEGRLELGRGQALEQQRLRCGREEKNSVQDERYRAVLIPPIS